jgi:uncharacterized repeat protein (TIGR03803 family)
MKRRINNLLLLLALIVALVLLLAGQVRAQTFTTLHTFTKTNPHTGANSDGATPIAGLVLSGNTLYGTAFDGGALDAGTVFAVNTDGTGFKTLSSLTTVVQPTAQLVLSSNTLYGTTRQGFGSFVNGTVFRVKTDGTGFTILHSFATGNGGANPLAGLVLSDTTLYGTTSDIYGSDTGTVFKINTDGTGFTNLYSFTGGSDGDAPEAGLVLSGNMLYGTTYGGGDSGFGAVFAVNTDGTGFTTLYSFTTAPCCPYINSDGAFPEAGLVLSGNTLYGTASIGGDFGRGTVFAVNTDSTGFTNLYIFTGGSDGGTPEAGLILSGNTLYGTANGGGSSDSDSGSGTVFAVKTDGTGFTNLHSFSEYSIDTNDFTRTNTDGANPSAPLILSGNTLYGTTGYGGSSGSGTVFSLTLPSPPSLTIIPLGATVVLRWPTNAAGFALQWSTNLTSPIVWSESTDARNVVGAQFTVTNTNSAAARFFRLKQ